LKFLHMTWGDIQRLCEAVAEKVRKAGYCPDMIVAISRGGFPPARILCDLLDVKALASVGIEYYKAVKDTKRKPVILYPLNADVKAKKILIVDDVADTGHSLAVARDHVLGEGASDVRIATLHRKPWSVVEPDFYAEDTDAWIVYVWEVRETVRQLTLKLRGEGKKGEEIKKELMSQGFREKTLRDLLG